ncbi:MAG: Clp protease N-terminal domain-containing protein [Solirubrobacteraceae bacterium]
MLERALGEAFKLGHNYIGTEHILLALASVGEGEGMNALAAFDVDAEKIRRKVIELLSDRRPSAPRSIKRIEWRRARMARAWAGCRCFCASASGRAVTWSSCR